MGRTGINPEGIPFDIPGLSSGVTAITAGGEHNCALLTGGGVKCWGRNTNGQLGNNSTTSSAAVVDVVGLTSGVSAIEAGYAHTCALLNGGGVKCWGRNADGELGDGTTTQQLVPVDVVGLTSGVNAISAGSAHTCAVTTSSGLKCWGRNDEGQIGNGGTQDRLTATDVTGLTSGVAQVSAGTNFTCALTSAGGVKCWGYNVNQSVGINGAMFIQLTPVDVAGLSSGVTALSSSGSRRFFSSGGGHSCVLLQTGALQCWGEGFAGQRGDGAGGTVGVPADVVGLKNSVTAVAAGGDFTCALIAGGGVKCWGDNQLASLGDASQVSRDTPANVFGYVRQSPAIATGGGHACAVRETGGIAACWGAADLGQTRRYAAEQVHPVPNFFTLPPTGSNFAGPSTITTGGQHSCAIDSNFVVLCWGNNNRGQLGNLSTASTSNPVPVSKLVNSSAVYAYDAANRAITLTAGANHTCAINEFNQLQCWGDNLRGQLGDGSNINRSSPANPVDTGFIHLQAAAGGQHTCSVNGGGAIYCWGLNQNGQLGNFSTADSRNPVLANSDNARMVAAGSRHTCSVTVLGGLQCWGANDFGQLGDGSNMQREGPVTIFPAGSGVLFVSAGGDTTCVLMVNGAIKCWGSNANGELGIGVAGGSRNVPTDVPQFAGGGAAGVSVGTGFVVALLPDSTSVSWGSAVAGRLANNTTVGSFPLPVQTLGPLGNGNLALAANDTFPNPFTLQSRFGVGRNEAVISNPVTVSGLATGVNSTVTVTGGLISINGGAYFAGTGSVVNGDIIRVQVTASMNYDTLSMANLNIGGQSASFQVRTRPNPADALVSPAIALGDNFTLILGSNGLVYAAGYNGTRQMGNGSTLSATAHAAVAGLTNIRKIAAGGNHALARRLDGTVVAWGYNAAGQLGGAGAVNSSGYPTLVTGLTGVTDIAAGQNHSLALKGDDTVWAWGLNSEGQLGTGNTTSTATPTQVLTGVRAVAAGGRHTLAIKSDGTLWTWGANESGQLGSGNTTPRSTPAQVGAATNWLAVAAGNAFSLALRSDGTLYAFGSNNKGQLGDGTTVAKNVPTLVASLTAIAAITAGAEHSLVLRAGGIAYTWGANDSSQLGDGLTAQRTLPYQIPNQSNLLSIAAGAAHSAALTKFGEVLVWGRNEDGQIGGRTPGTRIGPETIDTGKGNSKFQGPKVSSVSPPAGSSISIPSSSGTSVLTVKSLGYLSNDFGASNLGATTRSTYSYTNQSISPNASLIGGLSVSVSGTDFSLSGSTCALSLGPGETCEFEVAFVPSAAGDRNGTLIVDSDIAGSPQYFTLFGAGIAAATPGMILGQTQMAFAARPIATSEIETFLIGNNGSATLNVTSATSNLTDFGISNNCGNVAPGATCTVTVTFTPSASGTRTATLTLVGNAGTQTVALSGYGINAVVDFDPAPFSFTPLSSVPVSTAQTSNTITVSGIDTLAPVSVTNGEFSVGCTGTFTTGTGTINNGQTICVRHTSASTISTAYTTTLKIGGVSGQFTSTTANTPLYALEVAKAGAGNGSVVSVSPAAPVLNCGATCTANYNAGTRIELVAAPNAGSMVGGWTGCDAANGVRCIVTLNASRNVTVTFATSAATVPGAPVIGTATAGNAQATIAFSAPASNGGSPITHYTATCNPGAIRAVGTGGAAATPITVTGLANATAYTCSVTASNAAGTGTASATVMVTPQASVPFALIGVRSRKLHNGAGEFDLTIDTVPPITGNVTVEPRAEDAGHQIVFRFSGPVTQPGTATAVDANNAAIGSIGSQLSLGSEVIVTLLNIPDFARATVALANVNGAGLGAQASIGFLVGDTNQTRLLTAADVAGAKARAAQTVHGGNFLFDANGDGVIDAKDVAMIKARAGRQLP